MKNDIGTLDIEKAKQIFEWLIQERENIARLMERCQTPLSCMIDKELDYNEWRSTIEYKADKAALMEFIERSKRFDEISSKAPCSMKEEYLINDDAGNPNLETAETLYKSLCDEAENDKVLELVKRAFFSGMLLAREKTPAEFAQDKYSGLLESVIETNGEISEAIAKKIPSKKNTPDKITQEEAAELWHVSARTIRNWITGKYQPPDEWPGGLNITADDMHKCWLRYIERRNREKQEREERKKRIPLDAIPEPAAPEPEEAEGNEG